MSATNKHGVHISEVSDHVKKWVKYMPSDVTPEDVISFKQQHDEAIQNYPPMMASMVSKDVTYPGCYIASRLRAKGVSEDDIQKLLFQLGGAAFFNQKTHWKLCMDTLKKYAKNT